VLTDVDDDGGGGVGLYLLLIWGGPRDICIEEQRYVLGLYMLAYVHEFIYLFDVIMSLVSI
jgi:hypothetical protein